MLKRPKYPTNPIKMVVSYPEELHSKCPVCHSQVEFQYNSGKKTIYTLTRLLEVRYHLVCCTNKNCVLSTHPFNPTARFDYSQRLYGKDVLEKIGEYYIKDGCNSGQIYKILKREYDLPISKSTVSRMSNDILVLTSLNIDKNTAKIMEKQKYLLIALDGQEPDGDHPALWVFVDIISSRVIHTTLLESVDNKILHNIIEEIKAKYDKPIIGFISDKQSAIRVCMERFYPDIPHQYCTYHFSTNQWNHLEKYANLIHRDLSKTVKSLYIASASKQITIKVPDKDEKISLRELCAPLTKELKKLVSNKNEKFKGLRGLLDYEKLSQYLDDFQDSVLKIPVQDRFAKIMNKTVEKLTDSLERNSGLYENTKEGLNYFNSLHTLLWKEEMGKDEKIEQLDVEYEKIWERCKGINPAYSLAERKSFLPSAKTPYWKFLGEWTRLWESYKPGLFRYYEFPEMVKSNVDMEQRFSTETQRFRSQSGRSHIGRMIESRGEYVIRLQYASPEDLNFDVIISQSVNHLKKLRKDLNERICTITMRSRNRLTIEQKYVDLLYRMYELDKTKMEG